MTEEESTPPPPPPDPPAADDKPIVAGDNVSRTEFTELRDKVDDVEAIAHSAVQMQLEDDDDQAPEPEHTDVETRGGDPAGAKPKDETAPPATRHAGLFL